MTPEQAAARFDRIAKTFAREVLAAEKASADQAQTLLKNRSSGNLTTGQLARMGHPYGHGFRAKATRFGAGIDPTIINKQTGDFLRNWKKSGPSLAGGTITSSVVNTTMFGKYTAAQIMEGTDKMVARRVDTYVMARVKPIRRENLRAAVRRALRS